MPLTKTTLIDLSHFISEPNAQYRGQRGYFLSSHQLADFRRSPLLFRRKQLGFIGDSDSDIFAFGRAVHCALLEGQGAFERDFVIGDGPTNQKTGKPFGVGTKAWLEWRASEKREVVSTADAKLIGHIAHSFGNHSIAPGLVLDGAPELVLRGDYCGVPCQIRADWINPYRGLVDLKTCASIARFEDDCRRYEYVHQLAFYRAVIECVIGPQLPVYLIAVEKQEPFAVGVWRIGEGVLGIAQRQNEAAIARFSACQISNQWPTGYETMRIIDQL